MIKYLKLITLAVAVVLSIAAAALTGFGIDFDLQAFIRNVTSTNAVLIDLTEDDSTAADVVTPPATGPPPAVSEYLAPAD